MYKILIVDDEPGVRYSFRKLFSGNQYNLHEAQSAEQALEMLSTVKPDLVLLDIEMPGKSGIDALQEIKQREQFIPVIIMTAYGSGDRVIKAMKYGAYEYIEKPFDIPRLISLVEEALKSTFRKNDDTIVVETTKQKLTKQRTEASIVGESPAIKEVFKLIGRVAASDATILVLGESGTGKELVANAIHKYSERSTMPFLAVNCAAIPENLLESELFGYEKGAFTGADKQKPGRFEEAHNGTLFLDEIGDMSFALQAKILRVLQEGTFEKVGSTKSQSVDVRIIAATNRNLENDVAKKTFREDLYYRLKVVTITLPPLRMRADDIPLLARHFLVKHSHETRASGISIHPDALAAMQHYSWPGNIRELENCIKRCLILAKGNIITKELITKEFQTISPNTGKPDSRIGAYLTQSITDSEGEVYKLVIEEVEKELLQWALHETGGNRAHASRLLGISRVMLHERIEKYRDVLQ
jgi:two-component system nitrogen regulation response regulator GlnG